MATNAKKAGWVALAIATVGASEGLRQNAYPDVIGVPTICYGETRGVRIGDHKTKDQCDEMLSKRLSEFNDGINSCVKVDLPDSRRVAYVSLAYNIGTASFCKSTVVRKINAGDVVGSCNAIRMWNRANGIVWPGLTARREREVELCMRSG